MRVAIAWVGCRVNQYEAFALAEALRRAGWEVVPFEQEADLYLVNACAVTERALADSRRLARRALRRGRTLVLGCGAELGLGLEGVEPVGNAHKLSLPELLVGREPVDDRFGVLPREFGDRARALLKVQDGCDEFCSFCVVPYLRGPVRSLPLEEALRRAKRLAEAGFREVVICGVHLGAYGQDLRPPCGLRHLLEGLRGLGVRVRLSSLHPGELESVLDLVVREPFCDHLHLSVQSLDDGVLRLMRRPYRADQVRRLVEEVRRRRPSTCIGMDVLVGFPGEDAAAFERTARRLEELPLAYLHVFPYAPRPHTLGRLLPPGPPPAEVAERVRRLRALSRRKLEGFCREQRGRRLRVLVERPVGGQWQGLSTNYLRVRLRGGEGWRTGQELEVVVSGLRAASPDGFPLLEGAPAAPGGADSEPPGGAPAGRPASRPAPPPRAALPGGPPA